MAQDFFVYARGEMPAERLKRVIVGSFEELRASPQGQAEVAAAGLEPALLNDINPDNAITVSVESSGPDPASALLVIALTSTANHFLRDLWKNVLLPRIRRDWGADALGQEPDTLYEGGTGYSYPGGDGSPGPGDPDLDL